MRRKGESGTGLLSAPRHVMLHRMNRVEALVACELYPTPRWFPQSMDPTRQWVRMVRFSESDYRRAPFLDHRGLRTGMTEYAVPWRILAGLTLPEYRNDAHWIFHVSHAGSTLISRLLGQCDDVLCLREPSLLLSLFRGSTTEAISRLPVIPRLLSRCFRPNQRAIVKATSIASELAVPLAGPESEGSKALFVSIHPRTFIAGPLMSQNAKNDKRGFNANLRQAAKIETAVHEQDAIDDALNWLDRTRASSPLLDRACARFA